MTTQKVQSKIVEMTAAKAMSYLQKNDSNRPMSDRLVKKYAKLMREGKWELNGEAIIVADDGTLVDGQHRLQAILDSGSSLQMIVVTGVDKSVFKTVDIGKKRNGADALAVASKGTIKSGPVVAATITTILHFSENMVYDDRKRSAPPSHEELINFMSKNHNQVTRAVDNTGHMHGAKKLVPHSCLAALYYLFSKVDINDAEMFFFQLNTGERLSKGDPVLVLRNRLMAIRTSGGVFRTREVLPYVVKAWQFFRQDEKIERLKIESDYIPRIV